MRLVIFMAIIGALLLSGAAFSTLTGIGASIGSAETVPVSVRNNPASYRPVYSGHSGYRAPSSSSSSGGYSSGK